MLAPDDCAVARTSNNSSSSSSAHQPSLLERLADPIRVRIRKTSDRSSSSSSRRTYSHQYSSTSSCSTAFQRDSFASAFPTSPAAQRATRSTTPVHKRASALLKSMKRSMAPQLTSCTGRSSTTSTGSKLFGKTPASSASGSPRPVPVPHTITERHGGMELWVKAPMVAGEMEKQGFRWRKKWKTRYVELNSRMLSYYEVERSHPSGHAKKARKRAQITADGFLEDIDDRSFAITPSADEKPWVFRAKDAKTKLKWCKALTDCIDILNWLQHYELGDLLGVGGNGVVHQIVDKRSGKKFAVKSVDVAKFRNRDAVVSEVEILRSITNNIKHPNLVTIYKVYEEHDKIYIILELCEGGELYDSIVKRGCYSERDAARIMQQLMSALQALHAYNILHLDIKPENILFASRAKDAKIVVTDFGLARMINGKTNPLESGTSMAGTVGYIAPEVISSHSYTAAADVFSAGVILFILLVGYPPFQGDSEVEILLKIARGDFQFNREDWAHVSASAKELVARMLEVRADDRITVDEVLAHPWLTDATTSDRELAKTMERLQRFNFDRKSENMATFMSSMLCDSNEADYKTLADTKTIDVMIRQLSPEGRDRIPLQKAHILAKGLGLSPFIDEKSFVSFLDQDRDGFINAQDFCDGVKAVRGCDASFSTIIFTALHRVIGSDAAPTASLRRQDFALAFERLHCPEALSSVFFKVADAQYAPEADDGDADRRAAPVEWEADAGEFAVLSAQHPFITRLFLRTAKDNMTYMVKTRSVEVFPQIMEDRMSECTT